MTTAPRGLRLHIGVFGRRNAGKSTLLNLAAGQDVSIVSPTPGTTTDPVEKAMEFIPLGPVLWIDTAGIDDQGDLGELRAARSKTLLDRVDLAVIVYVGVWGDEEEKLYRRLRASRIPIVIVQNKIDLEPPGWLPPSSLPEEADPVYMSAAKGEGLREFRQAIINAAPFDFVETPILLRDLFQPGETVLLVTPIDGEAPKGRLILPQVQAIRDVLDGDGRAVAVRETQLAGALADCRPPPALVVTDSQVFKTVAELVPAHIPLTGFSILFARAKGDIAIFARGAAAISRLRDGDTVLVAESCTHHRTDDDIGRVKLPALIRKKSGADLTFRFVSGHDFPADLGKAALVLHCGACMTNRRAVLSRLARCLEAGVPVVNYGMAITYCLGLLERALSPFPEALAAFRDAQS